MSLGKVAPMAPGRYVVVEATVDGFRTPPEMFGKLGVGMPSASVT